MNPTQYIDSAPKKKDLLFFKKEQKTRYPLLLLIEHQ